MANDESFFAFESKNILTSDQSIKIDTFQLKRNMSESFFGIIEEIFSFYYFFLFKCVLKDYDLRESNKSRQKMEEANFSEDFKFRKKCDF